MTFAKLFETPDGQLLVVTDSDGEEDGPRLTIRAASIDGVTPQISHGPWSDDSEGWDHVHRLLADFDQAQADDWAAKLTAMVRNFIAAPQP